MLDLSHLPSSTGSADVQIFTGTSTAAGNDWQTWRKPRGKTMIDILLIGKGGSGATGQIGLNLVGGGGGGSGGQTRLTMPLALLPDILYLSLSNASAGAAAASYITVCQKLTAGAGAPVANDTLMIANSGGNGSAAGAAGTAGAIATAAAMPLGWAYATALAGQAGATGGAAGAAGTNITLPVTGLLVTGGGGGAGTPVSTGTGFAGGSFNVAGQFPAHAGGVAGSTATTPPGNGAHGYQPISKLLYFYGGAGGGSTFATATGAGLVQSFGGSGAFGCGGGGSGAAITGSTAGSGGSGGAAIAIIACW